MNTNGLSIAFTRPTRGAVENALQVAFEAGEPLQLEYRVQHPDGSMRWVASYAERRNVDGKAVIVGLVQDITERKLAEQRVLAVSETSRQLVEHSPFGVYVVNADFRLVQVSAGAQKVFESVRPLLGRDFAEVLRIVWAEPFASEAIALFRHTLETGEPYHSPSTVERPEDVGTVESYDWKIERMTLPDGRFGVVCHFYDLSERQRYEAALRESEDRYRATFDNAAVGIAQLDLEGRWLRFNDAICNITGYSRDELAGKTFAEITHADDVEPDWREARKLLAGEINTYTLDKRYIRKDERTVWVRLTVSLMRDTNGAPLHFIGVVEDIDARKRAEQAEREHAELLRTVLESTTDLVWVKDTEGRITLGNRATVALLGGGEPQRVIGLGARELIPDPEHAARVMANDARIMDTGRAERVEEYFGPSDSPMVFETVKSPLRDASGSVVGVVGVSRDVTGNRRIAERVQIFAQRQAFLVRLNDALRTLTEVEEIKVEAARLLGEHMNAGRVGYAECQGDECTIARHYTAGLPGVEGHYRLNDFGPIVPDLMAGRPIIRTNVAVDSSLSDERKAAHAAVSVAAMANFPLVKSGELVAILFVHHGSPHSYSQDELSLIEEVAERTWAAVQRGKAETELRAANRDLEQFAYSASHDLKEPLRNVALYSQLLQERYADKLDSHGNQFIGTVCEGAHRMELLVSDLLEYIQASQIGETVAQPVDAEQVLAVVLQDLSRSIQESGALVTHDPLPSLPVKEIHLQQLLQNLISNGIKYRKEAVPPRIHIAAQRQNRHWRFAVQDNGIGIAPQFHDQVFGIFKRLHARNSKYEGTGIGLALCQRIVERYGGRIWLESALDQGSVFYFTLPGGLSE